MYQHFVGIDISKNEFAVALHGKNKAHTYSNNSEGFENFFAAFETTLKQGLIVLETTGGYELALIHYLQALQCAIHRANTRKVKHFIRSFGRLAKTDAIDAQALAQYGFERHASLDLFQVNSQQKLLKLVQRRIELKQMLVQEKNRRQAPDQSELMKSFDVIINAIETEINSIEKDIDMIYKADSVLMEKKNVIKEIKGIGNIIATELIALLPELGTINRKKIASLSGLAPHPNESGKKIGYRSTRGGRTEIKPILFMAAMTASRSNSKLGDFYKNLLKNGKKKMVALTALMRKIIVIANAKMRDFLSSRGISQHG
jgi:transposase